MARCGTAKTASLTARAKPRRENDRLAVAAPRALQRDVGAVGERVQTALLSLRVAEVEADRGGGRCLEHTQWAHCPQLSR